MHASPPTGSASATSPGSTGRRRAHVEVRESILRAAASRVAADGAAALSLRAVARDVGMVSSAVYRYFASRDELLTALIVEAYDSLGAAAEAAVEASTGAPPAERWIRAAMAVRTWAFEHPHDYALIYGTPVPGYAAPDDTVVPGTRVSFALIRIVADALRDGRLAEPAVGGVAVSAATSRSFESLRETIELRDASDSTLLSLLLAWTQLFGLLTFELFGQTRNFVDDDEVLFRDAVATMALHLGLSDR